MAMIKRIRERMAVAGMMLILIRTKLTPTAMTLGAKLMRVTTLWNG